MNISFPHKITQSLSLIDNSTNLNHLNTFWTQYTLLGNELIYIRKWPPLLLKIWFLPLMDLLLAKHCQQVKGIAGSINLSWKIWYLAQSSWLVTGHRVMCQAPYHITQGVSLETLTSISIHLILLGISWQHVSILFRMTLSLPIGDIAFHDWMLDYIEDFLNWIHVGRILRQCDCCYISAFQVTPHLVCKVNLSIIKHIDHLLLVFSPIVSLQLLQLFFQPH